MAVRKIGTRWCVDITFQRKRHRLRSPHNSKMGAESYESVLRQKLARGENLEKDVGPELTFAAFSSEWLKTYVDTNNKPSERASKRSIINGHLKPFFGGYRLADINQGTIERYKASKASKLSQKTINNHLTVLRKALATAHEWGHIEVIPHIKWHRPMQQIPRFLTADEIGRLSEVPMASPWREMMLVALNTGMRVGELRALGWEDVDLLRRVVTVRRSASRHVIGTPKSNRWRQIPLNNKAHRVLAGIREKSSHQGLVFTHAGELVSYHTATKHLHRAAKAAAVKVFSWHTLRHTFASHLVQLGASMRAIQCLLGHATVLMTERYAHLGQSNLHDAVRLLEIAPVPVSDNFGHQMGTGLISLALESR